MRGIDISSHQAGIDLAVVPCDFVIIKATQGTSYVNSDLKRSYTQAVRQGKKIGLYHYASKGGAINEAKHFLNTVKELGALGKAILALDWESYDNDNWNSEIYAEAFLDYIKTETAISPFIYMSKSVCRNGRWGTVASKYPLWVAQYANRNKTGYQADPWTDSFGYGPWVEPKIFQYSSMGKLSGFGNFLDLDIAYMSSEEWDTWASPYFHYEDEPFMPYAATITASALNVRTAPGGPIMQLNGHNLVLPHGLVIAICEENNGWGRLSNVSGWVSLQYLES